MSAHSQNDPEFNHAVAKRRPGPRIKIHELMVIIVIVALMTALLLTVDRSPRAAARRAKCTNNLKQIALALHNYEQTYHALPPAYTVDASGRPLHSWRTLILPYLKQEALYKSIDLSKPWNDPANASALATEVGLFRCPDAAGPRNTTTYLALVGSDACFERTQPRPLGAITDAQSATLMVIEAGEENAIPWMAPFDADEALVMGLTPTSKVHHQGGTNGACVDGSVRFLKISAPPSVRRAMISISGNDADSADW